MKPLRPGSLKQRVADLLARPERADPIVRAVETVGWALVGFGFGALYVHQGAAKEDAQSLIAASLMLGLLALITVAILRGFMGPKVSPDPLDSLIDIDHDKIDLLIKKGFRIFRPHSFKCEYPLPEESPGDVPAEIAAAIRTLRRRDFIVVGPEGITPDRFLEIRDSHTYRRTSMKWRNRQTPASRK